MGCNISKDVKVEEQGEPGGQIGNGVGNGEPGMSEEEAAAKIQASFRGYQTRKSLKGEDDAGDDEQQEGKSGLLENVMEQKKSIHEAVAEAAGEAKQIIQEMTESISLDLTDAELEKAATKIQASFRGYTARREMEQSLPEDAEEAKEEEQRKPPPEKIEEEEEGEVEKVKEKQEEEENLEDIDLNDPEVEKAAVKIQATFRGYKSRREQPSEE